MRIWRFKGVHRLAWVLLALLVLAVAVFAMAAGFSRLRSETVPAGGGPIPVGATPLAVQHASIAAGSDALVLGELEARPPLG